MQGQSQPMPTDHYTQQQPGLPGPANPNQMYYTGNPISPVTSPAPQQQLVLPPPLYMPPPTNQQQYPTPVQPLVAPGPVPYIGYPPTESLAPPGLYTGDSVVFRNREGLVIEVSYAQNQALIDFGDYTNWIALNALQRTIDIDLMQNPQPDIIPNAPLEPFEKEPEEAKEPEEPKEPEAPAPSAEPGGAEEAPTGGDKEPTDEPDEPELEDEGDEEGFSFDFDEEVEARLSRNKAIGQARLRAAQRATAASPKKKDEGPSKKQKDTSPEVKKWDREVQNPETGNKVNEKWWALVSKEPDKTGNIKVFKYFKKVDRKKKNDNKPTEEEIENHKTKIAYFTMKNA